jgi:hypothetical protein
LTFFVGEPGLRDLKNPRAGWELQLEKGKPGSHQLFSPTRMEVRKSAGPFEKTLFHFQDYWSKGYYVWFDGENKLEPPFRLILRGLNTSSILEWKSYGSQRRH